MKMNEIENFWFKYLNDGSCFDSMISCTELYRLYLGSCQAKKPLNPVWFGREIKRFSPSSTKTFLPKTPSSSERRVKAYRFVSLDYCRIEFKNAMKFTISWDDG
jgi:hypothetical protein